jgi:MGT family glycosyltransferase
MMRVSASPSEGLESAMRAQPSRFLLTLWDGGGNVTPELGVARRLVQRGHQVHVLGDPTLAAAAESAGCSFTSWSRAPHRASLDLADDPVKDWEANDPLETLRGLRDNLMSGPAAAFAADTAEALEAYRPDVVLADTEMFGSVIAAQAARIPVAVVIPNLWSIPLAGVGDKGVNRLVTRIVNAGLPHLNEVRADYGLPALDSFFDQVLEADRIVVLTSRTFDPASSFVPENVRYVGPVLDDPAWVEPWNPPWPDSNRDPLVLVGFSSVFQDQGPVLQRVIDALSTMEVRALVPVGLMLDAGQLVASPNVAVVRSAPYTAVLDDASVVVTHGGHGTAIRTLAAGVPMVCMPMGRDQDVTAAQVVAMGAGVGLLPTASSEEISAAVTEVLHNDEFTVHASRLGASIAAEHDALDVARAFEQLVDPLSARGDGVGESEQGGTVER